MSGINEGACSSAGTDLSGWAEFNRFKWGCRYVIRRFQNEDSDYYGEGLFFEGKRGKWFLPPLNAYHPITFYPGAASKSHKLSSRWHETAKLLIPELEAHMGSAGIVFPPGITDMRPFIWSGFHVWMKYTYYLKLPFKLEEASSEIRGKIRKAAAMGYRTEKSVNMADILDCLQGTEERKGFSHQLTVEDLELARSLLGDKVLRCYVCYAPNGKAVSASVVLAWESGLAQGWVAGSKSEHITSGVVQLSQSYAFEDLSRDGFAYFDFAGANIPSVSKSKAPWGAELVPYYVVQKKNLKHLLRTGYEWGRGLQGYRNKYGG
ncbi:hypothetical protein AWM70_20110 [Paenibacillus yonginensis]|uniref:BioF2-like acetyltransferase domain-containing protein n=1 Tax=Paenibacillus yonginensis TaxID=1462996 RepID=A0A1B1N5A8_9BACL|nr:GNAT family N-acetyltransferase [Paenibacillus yonginensis]ANS76596.1 hypothetical protein AWM70_20110 [Paenibacillus yonginensis]